jgi:hypothetical protein
MTEKNIRGGFLGTGLVPFDPQNVLSKLDVQLRTPSPPGSPSISIEHWTSKTPQNPQEATLQAELIKKRISNHIDSSPTSLYDTVDQLSKGTKTMMHRLAIIEGEISALRQANEGLSKGRRAKKTRLQLGGTLTIQEAQDVLNQRVIDV